MPLPASAKTSGTVSAGEVVGAMAEMDCERVSSGERMLWRRPESEGAASSGVSDLERHVRLLRGWVAGIGVRLEVGYRRVGKMRIVEGLHGRYTGFVAESLRFAVAVLANRRSFGFGWRERQPSLRMTVLLLVRNARMAVLQGSI